MGIEKVAHLGRGKAPSAVWRKDDLEMPKEPHSPTSGVDLTESPYAIENQINSREGATLDLVDGAYRNEEGINTLCNYIGENTHRRRLG